MKDLTINIIWDSVSVAKWQKYFLKIDKPNIIQSPAYAYAIRDTKQQVTKFGIITLNKKTIGILQAQEIKLFGFLHFIFIDRGPIWFDDNISSDVIEAFFKKLNDIFPKRFGRMRRIMPELKETSKNSQILLNAGFKQKSAGYKTIWIDISKDLDTIRTNFVGKWRSSLKKAEKSNLDIKEIPTFIGLDLLLQRYMQDRLQKKYAGTSPKMIKSLVKYSNNKINYSILLNIRKNGEDIAMGLFFIHGNSATYQIGWTNNIGRKYNAHNLMLWHIIKILKQKNVKFLDLGGINTNTAKGVTKFKQSMGGEQYNLIGIYS